jgi:hypothetical protein
MAVLMILGFTLAFAAEKPPAAPLPPRTPEMSTAGRVMEISATTLRIERSLKGESEVMEFALERSLTGFAVGDSVKVSYRAKEGRNILIRAALAKKTAVRKTGKAAQGSKPK